MTRRNAFIGVGLALLVPALVVASNLSTPHTFTAGTPARASEVNANFAAVQTAVNSKLDANASLSNGSARLAALAVRSSDGATYPGYMVLGASFFDRTVGVNCSPLPASDGQFRCLPPTGGGSQFYVDASCFFDLLGAQRQNPPGWPQQTAYLVSSYAPTPDGGSVYDVHQPTVHTGTVYGYTNAPDGGLEFGCFPIANHPTVYDPGPVVLPQGFMPMGFVTL